MGDSVQLDLGVPGVALGWVVAEGCCAEPSSAGLLEDVRAAAEAATALRDTPRSVALKAKVRDLLRFGAYKPTGRGKPASEYLLHAAAEGTFPFVNTLVDINNLVSVESLLPISMVDLDRAKADRFLCRRGREGESYVFNPSGQVLDLRDLLLLSRPPTDTPCASPVKDSQATKIHQATARLLGVIYAPEALSSEAGAAAKRMAELITRFGKARASAGLLRSGGDP
jgi:DNA/RNA-binding domain of Phe-tRNA-synthetase-like protein